jgi:quercetin dioxygenase-like cupin family protein
MKADRNDDVHYVWGDGCDGWRLLAEPDLSVIQERMPPGTTESRHVHRKTRQFFYVLAGSLMLEVSGEHVVLHPGEGAPVAPGVPHQAICPTDAAQDAEFLVISSPGNSRADREPVDKE